MSFFSIEVLRGFRFLDELGFRCIDEMPTFVRFESVRVFVNVYHGRTSAEVGVEIGLLPGNEVFTVGALIDMHDRDEGERYRNPVARTDAGIATAVAQVADTTRSYGQSALAGDGETFRELGQRKIERRRDFEVWVKATQTRPLAAKAFKDGDFVAAARLYRSIRESLTPTEVAKLRYAEKRAADR